WWEMLAPSVPDEAPLPPLPRHSPFEEASPPSIAVHFGAPRCLCVLPRSSVTAKAAPSRCCWPPRSLSQASTCSPRGNPEVSGRHCFRLSFLVALPSIRLQASLLQASAPVDCMKPPHASNIAFRSDQHPVTPPPDC